MNNEWRYNEEDKYGVFHSRRRDITCPQCNGVAREVECFDVGLRVILCNQCGVIDV